MHSSSGADAAPGERTIVLNRGTALAVIVCWLFVVFDGYDLIVYGNVISSLQDEWGISSATAGTLGSLAFLGMMIGAVLAGRLSDAIGRKQAVIGCVVVLSVFTTLCAFATGPFMFGAMRLIAGLGLGGLVPTSNALAAELVPRRWRAAVATMMMSGVPIGGSIAALLGIPVIPNWGWRPMFLFALVPLFVLVPLALKYLPNTHSKTDAPAGGGFRELLGSRFRTISIMFALVTVVTLLAWYGLGTWLPKLMQNTGTDLGSALTFTLALNLGAVAGSFITAWGGVRFGTVPTSIVAAFVAGVALLALLLSPPTAVVYAIFVLAGVGTHGTQCLIIAAVASYYPDHLRGTALGWALGVGRIGAVAAPQIGGWLLAAGLGANSNFILFAVSALIASLLLTVVWKRFPVSDDAPRGPIMAH
ncbi:benzoate MFS transporter BenK [Rhodococcus aetherivorans]|uniref:Benzoate MFS transporter BenK n=1 Tax=Rhodococcus aetherivorans TaxID=191292 RepID=A0ABQ0YQY4_9NOCA|nr:aromatic acid/H+ symport family MFS transporter [Rhodococcus aetherivorans]ETT27810.1 major facilitator superfamily MFS_1 [Rhodococcus rhodochrous ATCC 21198]KDE14389.1 MFS transporter [Rhodococcus aetherivorans]MDV6292429.1 aromatic acid/H+ symport family MFS transporter [Rhodococcus aetherivorans]NGP26079.1 aromatic acid/H+ symport family MFS transporter [Rhodococcus aetherivorans]GES38981.1 benzoate MFS transporter BenK [Rhodococcus aetherivorans]